MTHTPESIADLIAAHRDGAVSTLALYDKLRLLAAGCATLEKERDELKAELASHWRCIKFKNDALGALSAGLDRAGGFPETQSLISICAALKPEPITESKA